jgi:FixJ family two-component response regulator
MNRAAGTVFIVDDAPEVRRGLSRVLGAAGYQVHWFESAESYLEVHEARNCEELGCLLLDIVLPGMSGLDLQHALADSGRSHPIVFLTGHGNIEMGVHAMKAGAVDFLTKPIDSARLIAAVDEAMRRDAAERDEHALRNMIRQRLATLTIRERQVMEQVTRGKLNKQIAVQLGIGEKTVKVHRARVMSKMTVRSVPELVQLAARVGIANEIPVAEAWALDAQHG